MLKSAARRVAIFVATDQLRVADADVVACPPSEANSSQAEQQRSKQLSATTHNRIRHVLPEAAVFLRQPQGAGLANEKGVDLRAVFFRENRAGRVQQLAARLQQRPECVENVRLQVSEAPDIAFAAQILDVRMATHDAGSRAGHVGQNGVERLAIPPSVPKPCNRPPGRWRPDPAAAGSPRCAACGRRRYRAPADRGRPDSSRWPVLPPGAAQASRTRSPAVGWSSSAARWAPASWIETRPSAKPGKASTATGLSSISAEPPNSRQGKPERRRLAT